MRSFSEDNQECTVISKDVCFTGQIKGTGKIIICGFINGEIQFVGDVYIERGGSVEGIVLADNLLMNGDLVGNVKIINHLSLEKYSKMQGDANINNLSIEEGAIYSGHICMNELKKINH